VIAAIFRNTLHNDLRHWLIFLNIIAIAALIFFIVRSVLSPKKAATEEKLPANLTPFYEDDVLEGRRLERVQGWALVFAAIIAVALPIYWLREPTREAQSVKYFDKNQVARGATLFANSSMPAYNSAISLQCANCHGAKGEGGTAKTTINGVAVNWKAPPLNTEALRFREDTVCLDPAKRAAATTPPVCELTDIITFGRPGTPMQPWGVAGGGPKNDQSIADLVAYIESIQLTPAEAQAQAAKAIATAKATTASATDVCPEYLSCPAIQVAQAKGKVSDAQTALKAARDAALKALSLPATTTDAELTAKCTTLVDGINKAGNLNLSDTDRANGIACNTYLLAKTAADNAQKSLQWAYTWQARRANVSDGQLLFELNCARCHTAGWSVFDAAQWDQSRPDSAAALGLAGKGGGTGGGIGFNLSNVMQRFGTDVEGGWDNQFNFVSLGSLPNQPYGNGGLGSGKMPGFATVPSKDAPALGAMLTTDMVKMIVSYERYCLDQTSYTSVEPKCATPTHAETPATTTTTVKKG